ncbi:MAG: phosphate acetyltransferase [Chthoniobacterales bacterium]|nr:phosphate acetyltransferase [Chthoniobacterales bacterium]
MQFIESVFARLRRHPKRIVFPEGENPRVLRAGRRFYELGLGVPILLGRRAVVEDLARRERIPFDHLGVINPENSADLPDFCRFLETLDRYRNLGLSDARTVMLNPNYYAAMMVQYGRADGVVGGIESATQALLRPLLRVVKPSGAQHLVSSCVIADTGRDDIGHRGVLVLGDCGVIPSPDVHQLAAIALQSAHLCRQLTGDTPRVALLSFSTKGSSVTPGTEKIAAAAALARQQAQAKHLEVEIDGELELDAALLPGAAKAKSVAGAVAGRANVLVFPDLNSGHIAGKLAGILCGRAYGQIITGLTKPAADVSRADDTDTITAVAAIVGLQAIEMRRLQEMADEDKKRRAAR